MSESIKAILGLVLIIVALGSLLAWGDGRHAFPHHLLAVRLGLIGAGAGSLGLLVWAQYRRDKVPDLLGQISRRHLNCNGLSFIAVAESLGSTCYVSVYFQNRYERPCTARLLFRPAVPHLRIGRPTDLPPIELTLECDGAAFGVARIPYPVPHLRQGATVTYDVGGTCHYPDGRGKMLRYHEGTTIRTPTHVADSILFGLSALTGHLHRSKDAQLKIRFPFEVAAEVPKGAPIIREVLWRP